MRVAKVNAGADEKQKINKSGLIELPESQVVSTILTWLCF